jgi:hypothetical protein
MTFRFSNFQIRQGPNLADPLIAREPQCLPDGVLEIGKGDGSAWRYLPEGYGAATASASALQVLSEELASLRAIASTDADLDAALAPLQVEIDALVQFGATDAELATAIAPIAQSLAELSISDEATATALASLLQTIDTLIASVATDAELASAIAQVVMMLPIRSATPPTNPAPYQRWIELGQAGEEIYDQPWIWRNSEWQLERLYQTGTGSGRISGSASPRMDLSFLPVLPGLAGYRLVRAEVKWALEAAGSWSTKIRKFENAATIGDNPPWIVGPTINAPTKDTGTSQITVPPNSIVPVTLCSIEFNLTKGPAANTPTSLFTLACEWAAVRA